MDNWQSSNKPIYIYCPKCKNLAWIVDEHSKHIENSPVDYIKIDGVFVVENFISQQEEEDLIKAIDTSKRWAPSQEGRAKQDYGPRISFLKKKVSVGDFNGFPSFANSIFNRMQADHANQFREFIPVEFCILEYTPDRGSYIRPHYDDKWIWGDRLVTVNLLSKTYLRLTKEFNIPPYEIVIQMPARSLIVISGEARYDWYHSINSYDIKTRRIAMTWREFGEDILREEEHRDFVNQVLTIANQNQVDMRPPF